MRRGLIIAVAAAVALGGAAGMARGAAPERAIAKWLQVFGDTLDLAQRQHVTEIDTIKAMHGALVGLMQSLGSDSDYISPEEFARFGAAPACPCGETGLVLASENGLPMVRRLEEGAPGSRAGILPGDYVAAVDGRTLLGADAGALVSAMRGEPGQRVVLTVMKPTGERIETPLVLALPVSTAMIARREGDYGYLRLSSLPEQAARDVERAIAKLQGQGEPMKGFVLDLRNNSGGLLQETVGMADLFMDGGRIVTLEGRDPKPDNYHARPGDVLKGLPMVVLVDGGTASGAEVIAAALQDSGRARVVGMTSFGQGAIHTVIPFDGGRYGALRLASARMRRPGGKLITDIGVEPDVKVARSAAEAARPSRYDRPVSSAKAAVPPAGFAADGDYPLARGLALLRAPA